MKPQRFFKPLRQALSRVLLKKTVQIISITKLNLFTDEMSIVIAYQPGMNRALRIPPRNRGRQCDL